MPGSAGMDTPTGTVRVALDVLAAQRQGAQALARRQAKRLAALVAHARTRSAYYRRRYRGLPAGGARLLDLEPVTKPELMADFDSWVTDPGVSEARVGAFMEDPASIGSWFSGEYFVCSTSGTTGVPGVFVHDRGACAVYRALNLRLELGWLAGRQWWQMLRRGGRWASLVGTGGNFAGEGWIGLERRRDPWRRRAFRVISVQQSLAEQVAELNEFDPAVLTSYPTALELLAEEQSAGRLHLHPVFIEMSGESSDPGARARIGAAFMSRVHDAYAASEFLTIGADCPHGWLHINSDWAILEPVGADYSPTLPGVPSHTVLLTNLANRVQPIIRYDLGDSVLSKPDPCQCGNPLPAIRVQGRRDDVLRIQAPDGTEIAVPPLAVGSALDAIAGSRRSQIVQTGPASLTLRLELEPGAVASEVWPTAIVGLRAYLASLGLTEIFVTRDPEAPKPSPTSGKFRQVIGMRSGASGHCR